MRYHNITKDDMNNGDGLRVVLWVAGCSHHCPECQNPLTWDPDGGLPFDEAARQEIFAELDKDYVSGITFSGGDPLFAGNRAGVTELITEIKARCPEKTIWLYTGYTWEEVTGQKILAPAVLEMIDVLVDGRYEAARRSVSQPWVGSTNQKVINVKERLNHGED